MIHLINALLMVVIPLSIAYFVITKTKMSWRLWIIGGSVFILSQIGHIPFNYLASLLLNQTDLIYLPRSSQIIFNACFLGLSAGLWEETFRYLMYRKWTKDSRSWQKGIVLGLGHGGIESIILGCLSFYTLFQMLALKNVDVGSMVSPEKLAETIKGISMYWSMTWYDSLLGSVERVFTIPIQVAFSILVLQVFIKEKVIWLYIAIIFHAIVDGVAVVLISYNKIYFAELMVAIVSIICIWIIFYLKTPEGSTNLKTDNPTGMNVIFVKNELEETNDNLDATIYL